jgi:UMF1 family MFS transporter
LNIKERTTSATATKDAKRGEILAWASYDVANSTYGTVVATAVYNAYFVKYIAGGGVAGSGTGTIYLTALIFISSMLIVFSAPIIGTISDVNAWKKRILFISTMVCVFFTAALYFVKPGEALLGSALLIGANVAFGTGEDLVAAFLPELAHKNDMGRISALGWAAGYFGGLLSLSGILLFILWAQKQGQVVTQFVPFSMLMVAAAFALASLPTFIFLKERATPDPNAKGHSITAGFARLRDTFSHAKRYRDLFLFLLSLFVYSCGTTTVIHLTSVYTQQVLQFTPEDSVKMILAVNVTAAVGAFLFGVLQDKIGSIKTLTCALAIWTVAVTIAALAQNHVHAWIAANLVGLALGATGSAGRALVGQFSPQGRSGEFLGLWGVAVKLATAVGAVSFGSIVYLSGNNLRLALLSTLLFFIGGLILLLRVNEERGIAAAHHTVLEENLS